MDLTNEQKNGRAYVTGRWLYRTGRGGRRDGSVHEAVRGRSGRGRGRVLQGSGARRGGAGGAAHRRRRRLRLGIARRRQEVSSHILFAFTHALSH